MMMALPNGQNTIIDDDDYFLYSKHPWRVSPKGYAVCTIVRDGKRRTTRLHRLITNAPTDMQVDHINGNRLDNRKCNLRICTAQENGRNRKPTIGTSKYKGVHWHKPTKKWAAQITTNRVNGRGKIKHLGVYELEEDAALAYAAAADKIFGEFKWRN